MIRIRFTKAAFVLLLPLLALISLCVILAVRRWDPAWAEHPSLFWAPYIAFGAAALLGAAFTQSRISYLSVLMLVVTYLLERHFFVRPQFLQAETVLFLSSVYIPPLVAQFYHLRERGMLTAHGWIRSAILASALLCLFLLPGIPGFRNAVGAADSRLFSPYSDLLSVPGTGLLMFVGAIPFLLMGNRHESPFLGPLMCVALLFVLLALNFHSHFWRPGSERSVVSVMMCGAGLTFAWAVLESSWRHANIDELTRLPGRRALKHHLACLGSTYAIAIVDIDHFKKINDTHGHDTGDQVLALLAALLARTRSGKAYRYGGEEFVLVFEDRDYDRTLATLEELRASVEKRRFAKRGKGRPRKKPEAPRPTGRGSRVLRLSISIGVARRQPDTESPQQVLTAADKALYRAKRTGRNRLCKARG